ncbi:MAG: hypothetical protein ACP5R5_09470 [Armatimonadota bacterium]
MKRLVSAVFLFSCVGSPACGLTHTIDLSTPGTPINRWIRGQAARCGTWTAIRNKLLAVCYNSSMRGVAGGLDADTYNWKTLTGRSVGPQTTLQFLREARDRNSEPLFTANIRGIGTGTGSSFAYTDTSLAPLPGLAADWVHYTNKILPNFRKVTVKPSAPCEVFAAGSYCLHC